MHNLSFHEHGELCCDYMVELEDTQSESKPWYDFTHVDVGEDHLEDFRYNFDFSFDVAKFAKINPVVLYKDYFISEPSDAQRTLYEEPAYWHSQHCSSTATLRGPPALV